MNFRLLVLFALISLKGSSQEKLNYSFDTFTSYLETFYGKNNQRYNYISLRNSKDNSYYLTINNNMSSGDLFDNKNDKHYCFKLKNRIEKVSDLKQLDTAASYATNKFKIFDAELRKEYKDVVEEIEFERDTVKKTFIVHRINFKNNKKKKILDEQYYIFKENKDKSNLEKSNLLKFLISKKTIPFIDSDEIEKIIDIEDGKKNSETEYITTKTGDIKVNFIVKEKKIIKPTQ